MCVCTFRNISAKSPCLRPKDPYYIVEPPNLTKNLVSRGESLPSQQIQYFKMRQSEAKIKNRIGVSAQIQQQIMINTFEGKLNDQRKPANVFLLSLKTFLESIHQKII